MTKKDYKLIASWISLEYAQIVAVWCNSKRKKEPFTLVNATVIGMRLSALPVDAGIRYLVTNY